jgi:hypothetical protein
MAFMALMVLLFGVTLFNAGGTVPGSGMAPAVQSGRAALEIVGVEPLAVAGRAFKAGERVRLAADGRRKTVTANARGRFKVVFPGANACNGLVVVASGSDGSQATVAFAQFSSVHCLEPGANG